jgi:hypothetical protein
MYLEDLKDAIAINPSICADIVKSIYIKKIYYLVTGRNAWHSTWVQHFYKRCISTECRELEGDAEKKREAGTVFYIEELPALCLELNSGCFILTEINTHYPLKDYDPRNYLITRNQSNNNMKLKCTTEQVFVGNSLSVIIDSIDSFECWNHSQKANTIFKLFLTKSSPSDFEAPSHPYAIRSSSKSGGKRNSLAWIIRAGKLSSEYIEKIASL